MLVTCNTSKQVTQEMVKANLLSKLLGYSFPHYISSKKKKKKIFFYTDVLKKKIW